ncbi:hypothetical protein Trydic_g14390 [Trypoxylus dichotomus]
MSTLPTIQEQEEPSSRPSTAERIRNNSKRQSLDVFQPVGGRSSGDTNRSVSKHSLVTRPKVDEVTVTEDCFGLYSIQDRLPVKVMRYTWKSTKNVEVQIITYGARIVSMKCPDRRGIVADVVLGCGDLAGYIEYAEHYFGATMGVVTGKIRNAWFELYGKRIKIAESQDGHYNNGDPNGLDKVIWNSYMKDTKVTLSHVIPHKHNGFPGPVMINITYELVPENEFRITMEARSAKSTIVNLSNLCYFNLGGHNGGPEELKKHSIVMNCNCYTLMGNDGFPSGKIMNVSSTKYDFMKPTLLKNHLGIEPGDGYDQNFCVNRATSQGDCLVARVMHTTNGRVLEIYSNQFGVRFDTANELGLGVISPPIRIEPSTITQEGNIFGILSRMYTIMREANNLTDEDFEKVHKALVMMRRTPPPTLSSNVEKQPVTQHVSHTSPDFCVYGFLDALEQSIGAIYDIIPKNIGDVKDWSELRLIIQEMIDKCEQMDAVKQSIVIDQVTEIITDATASREEVVETTETVENSDSTKASDVTLPKKVSSLKITSSPIKKSPRSLESLADDNGNKSSTSVKEKLPSSSSIKRKSSEKLMQAEQYDMIERPSSSQLNSSVQKSQIGHVESPLNLISNRFQDGRIHGKNDSVYIRHGGMAFQTQNYPNAIHHTNFPSPILRPGETYKHTIVYKFWVQNKESKPSRNKRYR